MAVTTQIATVYKTSSGRRYLTKRTAMIRDALERLKEKYEPEGHDPDRGVFGHDYFTDEQWQKFQQTAMRYYRIYRKAVK